MQTEQSADGPRPSALLEEMKMPLQETYTSRKEDLPSLTLPAIDGRMIKTEGLPLYHFSSGHSRWLMTEGIGRIIKEDAALQPSWASCFGYSHTASVVRENWQLFQKDPARRWLCDPNPLHFMHDMRLWQKSGELGRLLYFIKQRGGAEYGGFALATFRTLPTDRVAVCEAEWLRQYHEGRMESLEAHIKYAESRVPIAEYRGQFLLPEFLIDGPIAGDRLKWCKIPKWAEPIELKTAVKKFQPDLDRSFDF